MLRRLQIYYAVTVACVALQGQLCILAILWVVPFVTRLFERMSLELPLPTLIMKTLGQERLPLSGVAVMSLLAFLSWAWWARPREGQTSLHSAFVVTALQLPPAIFLGSVIFCLVLPLHQIWVCF
jgi:hypothetical protein